jgi:pyruvate dehydrogenase phosphatase
LVLLPPMKAGDATPREPAWDMLVPLQDPPKKRFSRHKSKTLISKEMPTNTSLSSHPVLSIQEEPQKENHSPAEEEREKKNEGEQPAQSDALGKLTSRVKNLLKRKNPGEKKQRKRNYYEVERVETVHWTEL